MLYETCLYKNVNDLKNVTAAVAFIGHALTGYGRGHTWLGSGCPREVGYLCFPQGPVPSYDWWHQFKTCLCDVSDWKSCLLCINALSYIYAPSEAIFLMYMPCSYPVNGEKQVLGSSLKGHVVLLNLSRRFNSNPSLKMYSIYWIRQKKKIHHCFFFNINW